MKYIAYSVLGLAFLATSIAEAATGVFGSYIGVNSNGGGNAWYGTQQWGDISLTGFQGANLGTFDIFSSDSLQISAFQVQTFKSDGGDVTGIQLRYRVYKTDTTPGSFNDVSGGFIANASFNSAAGNTASGSGDQNWGVNPTATLGNLLSGVSLTGTYNVEVFYRAFTNEGDQFSNNGGANYIATFTAVPEPSTWLIFGGALTTIMLLRKRSRCHA